MLSKPHPTIVTLKHLTATVSPYCYPHDVPGGDWFANYAKTRSEFEPPDELTVYRLAEAFSLAFEKMIPANPTGAAKVLGKMFQDFDPTQDRLFSSIADQLHLKSNILSLATYIDSSSKHAFMSLAFVITRETKNLHFLAQVCKVHNRTFEEEVAVHDQKYADRVAKVSLALQELGFGQFEESHSEDSLHYHLGTKVFGEPWAALYAGRPLSVHSIIRDVLYAQPPFVDDPKHISAALPDSYTP